MFEVNTVFPPKDRSRQFLGNRISTAKYTILTFLPLNLFEQFSKLANFYFLSLALLELIKPISDSGGVPTMMMPLAFVVGVSMIKDIFEDAKRHKSDDEENMRNCLAMERGG